MAAHGTARRAIRAACQRVERRSGDAPERRRRIRRLARVSVWHRARIGCLAGDGAHPNREETAMLKRALSISLVALTFTATIAAATAAASGLSERLQTYRMTVLKVDTTTGRFMCVEHLKWTPVAKADLQGLGPGDIVRVDTRPGAAPRLVLLRTAADELTSPE
jgi:hypothetical protein